MPNVSCTIDKSDDSEWEGQLNLNHYWQGALSISVTDRDTGRARVKLHLNNDEYQRFSNALLKGKNYRGVIVCGICATQWQDGDDPDDRPITTADGWNICWTCFRKMEDAANEWAEKAK